MLKIKRWKTHSLLSASSHIELLFIRLNNAAFRHWTVIFRNTFYNNSSSLDHYCYSFCWFLRDLYILSITSLACISMVTNATIFNLFIFVKRPRIASENFNNIFFCFLRRFFNGLLLPEVLVCTNANVQFTVHCTLNTDPINNQLHNNVKKIHFIACHN